jgi:hypothetical protein
MAGGSCGGGAKSGAFAEFAGNLMGEYGAGLKSGSPAHMIAQVAAGCAGGAISGGRCSDGAFTAAFNYLFNEYGTFDGKKFRLFNDDGQKIGEWSAISGRDGFQDPSNQSMVGKGPLPEGAYLAAQNDYQNIASLTTWQRLKSEFGGGTWPGLEKSWGSERVWLTPLAGEMFGRNRFSIHGGAEFGSAGCIDLARFSSGFFTAFRNYGQDIRVYVKYGSDSWLTGKN